MFKQITAFFVCLSLFGGLSGWGQAAEKEQGSPYGAWIKDVSEKNAAQAEGQPQNVQVKSSADAASNAASVKAEDPYKIVINIAARSLSLYKNNEKIRLYPVALGKLSTPTPVGYFSVLTKEENPTWVDPGDSRNTIPSGEY
ncbi:L,D-transpeptidase, partial [Selenomonas sp.]|uniref:L,D-transpeptidase n=1 Tax=Selenomonas sp. TaxID=2053611 RepID=UPI003FA304D3